MFAIFILGNVVDLVVLLVVFAKVLLGNIVDFVILLVSVCKSSREYCHVALDAACLGVTREWALSI